VFGLDQPVKLIRPHKFPWLHSGDLFNGTLTFFCGNPTDNGIDRLSDDLTDRCAAPLSLSRESPLLLGRDQYLEALCEHAHIIHISSPPRVAAGIGDPGPTAKTTADARESHEVATELVRSAT